MNDLRPTDPREQLEVRITALLLGEASAFEEAELLEAIKHDPTLAAYYEEMRQMVKRVEETIQLTPVEASVSQPKLADARRDQLKELFKQPAPAKTIKLDPPAGRARRVGWLQHVAAIAAALVILFTAAGFLLPALSKAKSKARFVRLDQDSRNQLIDQLGAATEAGVASSTDGDRGGTVRFTNGPANGYSIQSAPESSNSSDEVVVELDERFLARYGSSQNANQSKRPARMPAAQPAEQPPAPAKPADIYLPSASVDAAGAGRGLAADNAVRYYFRDSGLAAAKDSVSREGAAAVGDLPTLAFAVPAVLAPLPRPAPVPLELQGGRTELLTDSLARRSDATSESETVLGRKLVAATPALATKSDAEELRPVTITGSRSPSSDAERRFRRLYDVEAKDSNFDGAALPAGSVRGRPSGGARGAQVDGLAAYGSVSSPQLDQRALSASSAGGGGGLGGGRGWAEGRPAQPAPGLAGGGADVAEQPVAPLAALENQAPAANTWHADFGAMSAAPAVESFGRGVVADDFVASGQVTTELFAKQQADTKSVERLERRGEETSLGLAVNEAKVPVVPMHAEQLLTEQRQLDRERVEELGKGAADRAAGDLEQVRLSANFIEADGEDKRLKELSDQGSTRGEGAGRTEVELKRKGDSADSPSVFTQESLAGVRLLTSTNDVSHVNKAIGDYLKSEGVELSGASTYFYNDRKGTLLVRAPAEELEKVERAMDRLNRGEASPAGATTQTRFDTLADLSSSDFALAADNGREQQVQQQIESAPVAAPEVTQPAEEVVESQPATPPPPSLAPLPEIRTADNAFSTFSLNVSDVSFQLAASSLENGQMPDGARLRSEEFINAFDYRDPLPAPGQRVAFNWERARNPFAHNRELLRFSVQTAAAGREPGQPLNLVLLLDNSGSMERADRVQITEQMLRVLAASLNDYDRISVISFARTPRLIVDGATGGNPEALLKQVIGLNPDGGTNLEDAMKLAYETAAKHFQPNGNNRVILITDGAANLGNVDPAQLRERVIDQRKRGIALDCFGVGWEGFNDKLLESLSRNGDGRYGFLNDAENAPTQFASQLAGALQVAAADVKAQIEFNPNRVTVYRQIGYQQHQLTKEQFRDNTVDAAEIGATEAGNALYSVEVNPSGSGPIGTFRVRYRVPSTGLYEEKEWVLDYTPSAGELEKAAPAMRLASASAAFAEWLANSPYAQTVTPDALQNLLRDVPEVYAPDPRPAKLQAMIQQARAISGR